MTPLEALEHYSPEKISCTQRGVESSSAAAGDGDEASTVAESEHSSTPLPEDDDDDDEDDKAPNEFICPLTLQIMVDPVMSRYGQSFEREAILKWLAKNNTCPLSRKPLFLRNIIANHNLRLKIRKWELENDFDIKLVMDAPNEDSDVDGDDDDNTNHCARVFGYIDLNDEAERSEDPRVILEYTRPPLPVSSTGTAAAAAATTHSRRRQRRRQRSRGGFFGRFRRSVSTSA